MPLLHHVDSRPCVPASRCVFHAVYMSSRSGTRAKSGRKRKRTPDCRKGRFPFDLFCLRDWDGTWELALQEQEAGSKPLGLPRVSWSTCRRRKRRSGMKRCSREALQMARGSPPSVRSLCKATVFKKLHKTSASNPMTPLSEVWLAFRMVQCRG